MARKRSKFKAHYAVFILLFITIGAALAAFFWLGTIEKHIEYKDIIIRDVKYDSRTNDVRIYLINGLSTAIPVRSSGAPNERTVVTMYPASSGKSVDCDFVPLSELECDGLCDGEIEPGKKTTITLRGTRAKCILVEDIDDYNLNIFFGMRAPVSKEFSIR